MEFEPGASGQDELQACGSIRCADRVKDFVANLVSDGSGLGEVVVWYDWMPSMSFPQAHVEINLMFTAPSARRQQSNCRRKADI